ncbi:TPA: hypothetical protein ACM36I_004426 [Escherichia coli]|uniref:Uncharacterized protein n=2 Tax=Enterobacteriaceae TaxID=543 RepID=A0A8T6PY54_ECOLX|nr:MULTISPECIES: hypothetical protein [Enterobacteriaceae]EHY4810998.1 hypothetical protein [Salmonella enterica subsp. enterica serovar Rough:g,s,t:-]EIM9319474.1 hypothetical protein [Salmonella enterica]MCS5826984.1 hypothetical protein [Klebsiella pneumoniae subsp. pneumoniae]MDU2021349.1 hypothetical protein [Leclercia adecarboxylata]HCL1685541.1 hypothetical protein [Salmonella enterica subsp. enterica serovar Typhimurium]HDX4037885.1 hypothetical protein [Citrobacter youngae]HEC799876
MRSFTMMSLLETFLTASQGATILFLAMLIYWQKR